MKAAVRSKYGPPEVLRINELDMPIPKDNEVLIRVYAATVSRTDCHVLSGMPFYMRFFTGLFKPDFSVTGTDFAGQVESVGKNVTAFKVKDKVMGFDFLGLRSHAQYLTVAESKIGAMPDNITYDEAAACVEGVYYAFSIINKLNPTSQQKALVSGATGAIGSAIVQFFKFYGTYVTAVCNSKNAELVRSLGADKLIFYDTNDFTKGNDKYDFVVDAIGKSTFGKCKRLLTEKGIYSSSGAPNLLRVFITSLMGGKREVFAPPKNLKGCLSFIKDLVEKGSFSPLIDRKYPLEKIAEAFQYVGAGQKIGNVLITMDP